MEQQQTPLARRSIRLSEFDYAQDGAYFITIVTDQRHLVFGDVVNGEMVLNPLGQSAQEEWQRSAELRPSLTLDSFVVMPNHVHGVLFLLGSVPEKVTLRHENAGLARRPRSLGSFIGGFKGAVTSRINRLRGTADIAVWQRNYYEHVIRNDSDLARIREYVVNNPAKWEEDLENLNRVKR